MFCLLCLALFVPTAQGQAPNSTLILTAAQSEYPLGPYLEYLEDPAHTLTFEMVSAPAFAERFVPNNSDILSLGYTNSSYWLRVRVRNEVPATLEWCLALHDARVGLVDVYLPDPNGPGYIHKATGRNLPFTAREVPNREFIFKLTLPPATEQVIYLRVESTSALLLPLTLWTPAALAQYSQGDYLGLGLGYGVLLVMAAYNLFLFFALRDHNYLLYVLVVLGTVLTQASLDGLAHQYLWPGLSNRYGLGPPVLVAVLATLAFTMSFLNTAQLTPRLHRLLQLDALCGGGVILFTLFFSNLNIGSFWILLSLVLIGASGLLAWRRGYAPARFFVLATSALLLGTLAILLANLELLPANFPAVKGVLLGYVISALLWSFALADRIQRLKAQLEQANELLRASEQRLSQFLDAIPVGIAVHTTDAKAVLLNRYERELFGDTQAAVANGLLLHQHLQRFTFFAAGTQTPYPTDKLPIVRAFQGQPASAEDIEVELHGQRIPLSATASPILAADGRVSYVVSAFEDITQRRQTEVILQQTNAYLTALHQTAVSLISDKNTAALLEVILNRAAVLVGCEHGFLHLLEPEANLMQMRWGIGLPHRAVGAIFKRGEGLVGQVWATEAAVVVDDYQTWPHRAIGTAVDENGTLLSARYRAMIGVPLKSEAKVVGVIGLVHLEAQRRFTPLQVESLSRFAALASVVLGNARLHEQAEHELAERRQAEQALRRSHVELEERVQARTAELAAANAQLTAEIAERRQQEAQLLKQNEYLAALQATTVSLIHHLELFPLLEAIITRAAALMGTTHGQISLLEAGAAAMWQCIGIGIDSQFVGDRTQRGEGLTGRVWLSGQPLVVEDYRHWAGRKPGENYDVFRASVGVPLTQNPGLGQMQVVGVLNLDYDEPRIFQPTEIETLERFAQLASVALENAGLYQAATSEQSRLQALVRAIRDGLVLVELDQTIRVINAPALKLLGLPGLPESWVGRPLMRTFGRLRQTAPEALKVIRAELRRLQYGGEPANEGNYTSATHSVHWINAPVFNGPQVLGRLLILQDQTEQRQLEKMREDLTHTMVHDLRNPLTAILLNLEALEDEPLTARQQQQTQRARQSGERMLNLVNAILDISRLESGQMPLEYFLLNFNDLLREVLLQEEPLARQKNIKVNCELEPNLPSIAADSALIGRVLQNLVGNALKFTPAGGEVWVRVQSEINFTPQPSGVLVSVSDNGPGLPVNQQERLFQKFVTGHKGGSGLGLAFCKLAVEAHQGHIWAESRPDHGTVIKFTLPNGAHHLTLNPESF